jgi:hypothetical protein
MMPVVGLQSATSERYQMVEAERLVGIIFEIATYCAAFLTVRPSAAIQRTTRHVGRIEIPLRRTLKPRNLPARWR